MLNAHCSVILYKIPTKFGIQDSQWLFFLETYLNANQPPSVLKSKHLINNISFVSIDCPIHIHIIGRVIDTHLLF